MKSCGCISNTAAPSGKSPASSTSPPTASNHEARAKLAGLFSPLPPDCDDAFLKRLLFPPSEPSSVQRLAPAGPTLHNELGRKGVTLELLWQEYKAEQPDGYGYSALCEHYRRWPQQQTTSMRQSHTTDERLFHKRATIIGPPAFHAVRCALA
ncbi:hypothetical protein [Rugamonas sp.]|uniref:hypothetical protein n=1 Tax=Rugamonas sp. TaxID=1926287 RepID=UPI0025DA4A5C|nr:hypothetical protein [Rugamonas sp.]